MNDCNELLELDHQTAGDIEGGMGIAEMIVIGVALFEIGYQLGGGIAEGMDHPAF